MSPRRLKDGVLERYLANALDPALRAEVEAALAASPEDKARLAELRGDSAAFLLQHPPGPMVDRIEEATRRRVWRWPALLTPVLAACLALVVWVRGSGPSGLDEPEFGVKGTVALTVHKRQGERSAPVQPGQALAAGDALRFELRAPQRGYVAVLARDARGEVTIYYPFGEPAARPYDPGAPLLPGAISLDDTQGTESIFALYAKEPFELSSVMEALREGKSIEEAAPRLAVDSLEFVKR